MKRIILDSPVLFNHLDKDGKPIQTAFKKGEVYTVGDEVASHPLFLSRLTLCDDIPEVKPIEEVPQGAEVAESSEVAPTVEPTEEQPEEEQPEATVKPKPAKKGSKAKNEPVNN